MFLVHTAFCNLASKSVVQAIQKWTLGVTLGTRGRLEEPCVRTGRHRSRIDAARRLQAAKSEPKPLPQKSQRLDQSTLTGAGLCTLALLGEGFV